MRKIQILSFVAIATLMLFNACDSGKYSKNDTAGLVNPFVGTDGHGHTYPGATLPFGMVQLSPNTRLEGWDGCSGYHYSDSVMFGFSHTALSGTGVPDYNDILLMPTTGAVLFNNGSDNPDEGYASRFSHDKEEASPGFYGVFLDDYNIQVDLTSTKRVGFHQYTFKEGEEGNVIIDLVHRDKVVDSWIKIVNDHEVRGMRHSTAWAANQYVYFVARFSKPFKSHGIAINDILTDQHFAQGDNHKAFFTFDLTEDPTVMVKVGISAVNAEGALKNLEAEIPDWDFEQVRTQARHTWNEELGKVEIEGGSTEQQRTFYTALYHAFLAPNLFQDVDGKYRGRDLEIHEAKNHEYYTVFSLWDTFRGAHPLFTILQQSRTNDFIQTMLKQYEQGGRLPVWELAANETECMIGYHSIPVIADAYIKGIRGYDTQLALQAMKNSAEKDHFGLDSYKSMGYVAGHLESESVSKTLEYAYDDWCIATMAKEMGEMDEYERYIKRAQSYKNVFDPSTGFMRARMNGRWFEPFDPREVNFNYTEANSWQYSFFVPHDVDGLMDLLGGKDAMINKLDDMFNSDSETTGRHQSDITGLIGQYAHGNEPSHHMAFLYTYAGQPWKTQKVVRKIMNDLYDDQPAGLCGNEDCGQMSAWYVLNAMGFYSVLPGSPEYVLGSPIFDKVTLHLENGNSFVIEAENNSESNIYVQNATLNGDDYQKQILNHNEIMKGGILYLTMGPEPNKNHGSSESDLPKSAIDEHLITPVPFVVIGERTFMETTEVALSCIDESSKIYFTLDGSIPDENSKVFTEAFVINKSADLRAIAVNSEGIPSQVLQAAFHKIPAGRSITLKTKYANQYSAGGDLALIDFIEGPLNFRTGAWQGYEEVDIEAIIDLGTKKTFSQLRTGFIQDVGSWIFMPENVTYFISVDGENFREIGKVENELSERALGVNIQHFSLNFSGKARYIKMHAKNKGVCPTWHVGDGNPCWIFADEIVIR